jgi:hypothetical protein
MADVATPSAAKMATADTSAPEGKQAPARPEKPDEDAFKEELAKAEKAHAAAQEKLVRLFPCSLQAPAPAVVHNAFLHRCIWCIY